jgi:hypothetical protein
MSHSQRRIHKPFIVERSRILVALASSGDEPLLKRATKLSQCCCSPLVQLRAEGGIAVIPVRCRDRLCPLCAHRRSHEMGLKYTAAVNRMDSARHLVLTAPAVDAPLRDQLDQLRASVRRLRQQHGWNKHVEGGVYSIEITRNKQTGLWHPHVHLILTGGFYPHAEAARGWREALMSSEIWGAHGLEQGVIVYLSAVHNRASLAKYIAKYISKPGELHRWPPSAICEYARAVRGLRMMHTFGVLHGVKLGGDEPNAVPEQSRTIIGLSELDWRAQQGYPAAEAAVALLRATVPVCSLWIGARRDAALDAWAISVENPGAELSYQVAALQRQVATGPPDGPEQIAARKRRDRIEAAFNAQLTIDHELDLLA